MVNIRTKGQTGEREVAKMLNELVAEVRREYGLPVLDTRDELFQRNQNQSAVGGHDLSNPLWLGIEVKRQEQLSINGWWKQVIEATNRDGTIPILIFKQNRQKWRVCMLANLPLQPSHATTYASLGPIRAEISLEDFKSWFLVYYRTWLDKTL